MRAAVREGLRGLVGGQRRKNRSFWVDDLHINSCYECDTQFSFVNRKHHCRACGRVFCGRCTVYSLLLAGQGGLFPAGLNEADEPARVCQHCATLSDMPSSLSIAPGPSALVCLYLPFSTQARHQGLSLSWHRPLPQFRCCV